MASSEQKRQKKLAKQKAKTQKASRDRARRKQDLSSLSGRMRDAGRYPLACCKISPSLFELPGLGSIMLARRAPNGQYVLGFFLVDAGCLGIKNAGGHAMTQATLLEQLGGRDCVDIKPENALAMLQQAVAFADRFGFAPHDDYRKVLPLFGSVDASQSDMEFRFGDEEGKPYYQNGPFEDAPRQKAIVNQLHATAGPGNYNFVCGLAAENMSHESFMIEDDESELVVEEATDDGMPLL